MWKCNWLKAVNDIDTFPFPSIPHQLSLRWIIVINMSRYLNGVTMFKIHVCWWARGTFIFTLDTNISPNEGALMEAFSYKRR